MAEDWRAAAAAACAGLAHVCASSEKHKAPSRVLKAMHILISLIIHPYVTDERILVPVSGAGNMRGRGNPGRGGGGAGGRALFKAPDDCVPAGAPTSPCAQRRAR